MGMCRCPYNEVASFVYRYSKGNRDIEILEVGSGDGNNLWYLTKEGFDIRGIEISQDKLMKVESIMFDNGCLMGVTKKEILLYFYLSEIKKSKRSCFNRYEVRVRRKKYIRRLDIVALNRYDLFIQLSKKRNTCMYFFFY